MRCNPVSRPVSGHVALAAASTSTWTDSRRRVFRRWHYCHGVMHWRGRCCAYCFRANMESRFIVEATAAVAIVTGARNHNATTASSVHVYTYCNIGGG